MKAIIFDSGTLINLSMNGLLYILEDLKKNFNGKFLITEEVKFETIDKPSGIFRFELGALRIKDLLQRGIIETPNSLNINNDSIKNKTNELLDIANHFIKSGNEWINIVSAGEISCLALSDELAKLNIENIIAVDERTTRLLGEDPKQLENIMQIKLHKRIELIAGDFKIFSKYRFIRSTEIVFVACKKNLLGIKDKKALEAVLYATKFHGSAVSFEEIEEMKKL